MNLIQITHCDGLPEEETDVLNDLIEVWWNKLSRNETRMAYYQCRNRVKDLGISIPPNLRDIEMVVGWPAKAVDALACRSRLDGIRSGSDEELVDQIVKGNRLNTLYSQATSSELISSCSFMTVSKGQDGEPPAIISAYSAEYAAAIWDRRNKRIKYGMAVVDIDKPDGENPEPTWVNLYTDTDVWEIKKDGYGWTCKRHPHSMGRPTMEPLVYRPSLDRPFGKSRISRAVMSITDCAVRTALRSEVGAEFYTAPQKYILGAQDSLFEDTSKWDAYIGNVWAITKDEDGDVPQFGQLSQATMTPHTEYMRSLAARFSGETSIPVSELGVIHDNPSSAEAIYAAKESLVIEAESLNDTNGDSLREIARMAVATAKNKELSEIGNDFEPKFKNPAMPSIVSRADSIVKIVGAFPFIAESDVALEEVGFTSDQIARIKADKKRAEEAAMAAQLFANGAGNAGA